MFNLLEVLSLKDKEIINAYITKFGWQGKNCGIDNYLRYWSVEKIKLYKLLGNKLIHKIPYQVDKPKENIVYDFKQIYGDKIAWFYDKLSDYLNNYSTLYFDPFLRFGLYRADTFIDNKIIINGVKSIKIQYKDEHDKLKTKSFQEGMKPIKVLQDLVSMFVPITDREIMSQKLEEIRISISQLLNQKVIKGNLCFSIHPLDFLTMSDNASGWKSCMNWHENGSFRLGTVEMLNSNNVICCYLEGEEPYKFNEQYSWNNKKWRCLFYVTKDIIVSGKAYPYQNKELINTVLNEIRTLALLNLKWNYNFGPELYQDMRYIDSLNQIEENRRWIFNDKTFKHNIIFDTRAMYNDMFNDKRTPYYCVRNKVNKNKIISYSGKAPCLKCGNLINGKIDSNYPINDGCGDDYYLYDQDGYNNRYLASTLFCRDCSEGTCSYCDSERYPTIKINGDTFCKRCAEKRIRKCTCCGDKVVVKGWYNFSKFYIRYSQNYHNGYGNAYDYMPFLEREDKDNLEKAELLPILFCEKCEQEKAKSDDFIKVKYGGWRDDYYVSKDIQERDYSNPLLAFNSESYDLSEEFEKLKNF